MSWKEVLHKTDQALSSFVRPNDEPEHDELLGSGICRCKDCKQLRANRKGGAV